MWSSARLSSSHNSLASAFTNVSNFLGSRPQSSPKRATIGRLPLYHSIAGKEVQA